MSTLLPGVEGPESIGPLIAPNDPAIIGTKYNEYSTGPGDHEAQAQLVSDKIRQKEVWPMMEVDSQVRELEVIGAAYSPIEVADCTVQYLTNYTAAPARYLRHLDSSQVDPLDVNDVIKNERNYTIEARVLKEAKAAIIASADVVDTFTIYQDADFNESIVKLLRAGKISLEKAENMRLLRGKLYASSPETIEAIGKVGSVPREMAEGNFKDIAQSARSLVVAKKNVENNISADFFQGRLTKLQAIELLDVIGFRSSALYKKFQDDIQTQAIDEVK